MPTVGVREAKASLSRLLKLVTIGEEVIITNSGSPVARLIPIEPIKKPSRNRKPGIDRGRIQIPEDFDDPMEIVWVKK